MKSALLDLLILLQVDELVLALVFGVARVELNLKHWNQDQAIYVFVRGWLHHMVSSTQTCIALHTCYLINKLTLNKN